MTVTCAHGAKAGELCLLCHGYVETEEPRPEVAKPAEPPPKPRKESER